MELLAPRRARRPGRFYPWIAWAILAGCAQDSSTDTHAPVARAGSDQTVTAGASVSLDGSASSDPDGDPLTFRWAQQQGTPVSIGTPNAAITTFTAPSTGTALAFELKVSDGVNEATGRVNVTVQPAEPSAQINELSQPSIMDNPAVQGTFPNGWSIATLPPGPQGVPPQGAPKSIGQVEVAPLTEIELAPGATRQVEHDVAGPAALMATVQWIGTLEALPVTLTFNGVSLGAAESYSTGPDRGGSSLKEQTTIGGRAVLAVTNTTADAVQVRMLLGSYAL